MVMIKSHFFKQKTLYAFLLAFAWFLLIVPLIDTKIIPGHDYIFHVTRIINVSEAIKGGMFPVRIYADDVQFWGTPVGIFYPSLFNYFPVLLKLIGFPVEVCYNIFIALIFLLGIYSSWLGFSLLTKSKEIGFYSTVLYISSGYYLLDAYIRNALGEMLGISFLPLVMACIVRIVERSKVSLKVFVLTILSISVIIQSHVLCSAFVMLFGIFCLVKNYKNLSLRKICRIGCLLLLILLLNATFILPFLLFYSTVPVTMDFIEGFAEQGWPTIVLLRFFLLWNFWLFLALCFFISRMVHVFLGDFAKYSNIRFFLSLKMYLEFFMGGVLFFFLSDTSFPWNTFSSLKRIFEVMQFPWRFLAISTLCFCVCGGFGIHLVLKNIKLKKYALFIYVSIVCITSLAAFYKFSPISSLQYWKVPTKIYWERFISTSDFDYLYKGMDIEQLKQQGDQYFSEAYITNYRKQGTNVSFSYNAENDSSIILPLVNYPGYVAMDQTGKKIRLEENENHVMVILLPKGHGNICVRYEGLLLFKISDAVSAICFIGFIIWIVRNKNCMRLQGGCN